jgi:hypothetical protein
MSEFSQAIPVTGLAPMMPTATRSSTATSSLKGRTVFVDADKSGLFNADNDLFGISDAHGRYRIFGVEPGPNRVRMLGVSGFEQTFPSKSAAFQDVTVTPLGTTAGVRFGQRKSTAKVARIAIDAGSTQPYVDLNGQTFATDTNHDDANLAFDVLGTDDDPLYYVLVSGHSIKYSFDVPNGKYLLKVLRRRSGSTAEGQFNVTANGKQISSISTLRGATAARRRSPRRRI